MGPRVRRMGLPLGKKEEMIEESKSLTMIKSEESKSLSRPESEGPQKSQEEITSCLKTRSVSLSRTDEKKQESPTNRNTSAKKKTPPFPVSVQERLSRFEQVQNKYLKQRCQREMNREKQKTEKPKGKTERKAKNAPDEEESLASMLKKIHADIQTIKSDLKDNTNKVNGVNSKIEQLEGNFNKSERETNLKFEELKAEIVQVEASVTTKVVDSMEPKMEALKNDMKDEMLQMMRFELENNYQLEKRKDEVAEDTSEGEPDDLKGEPKKKK